MNDRPWLLCDTNPLSSMIRHSVCTVLKARSSFGHSRYGPVERWPIPIPTVP